VWKNGKMIELNKLLPPNSGWKLQYANAINNKGQIVGYGTFQGQTRAFLLKPLKVSP
jgi:probable HAF family extracellular repeat protein